MPGFTRHCFVVTLLAAACLAVPAQAQGVPEQTVENAQKFLSMALPKKGYVAGSLSDLINRVASQKQVSAGISGQGVVTDASAVGHCVSRILYDNSNVSVSIGVNRDEQIVPLAQINPAALKGGLAEGFHWGDVLYAKQSGADVLFLLNGNGQASRIHLGSEALAARVAYAMEFLRMNCDKTAETGF